MELRLLIVEDDRLIQEVILDYFSSKGWRVKTICRRGECLIENTGFPMEEEQKKHAFDMLYSGDKSQSGHHLGMGLYLTKKILDRHGIDIAIENRKDGVRVILKKNIAISPDLE